MFVLILLMCQILNNVLVQVIFLIKLISKYQRRQKLCFSMVVHTLSLETITFLTIGIEKINVFRLYGVYIFYMLYALKKKTKIRIYYCYNLLNL